MKIDLHNHSTHSDGAWSVKELMDNAIAQGIDIMALTDHDSVFGIEEALEYASQVGLRIIPGIELSTYYKGEPVHCIGLFKKGIVSEKIKKFSEEIIDKRVQRARKMMQQIEEIYGLKVDYDNLFSSAQVITRGNMLRCLLHSNPGLTMEEAKFYISNDSKAYLPSSKLDTKTGVEFLKESGAVVILAHPVLLKKSTVEELLPFGFDGLEFRYPSNEEADEEKYLEIARNHGLLLSAGSDCHGDRSHAMIGTSTLNEQEFIPLAKAIGFELEEK